MEEGKKIVDTPADGDLEHAISSNWAYDHSIDYQLHTYAALKAADQSVINSTVLVDDDTLVVPVGANEIWSLLVMIMLNSPAAADFDFAFSVPAAATMNYHIVTRSIQTLADATVETMLATNGNDQYVCSHYMYVGGANAGNIQLQWAQNVANAGATKVLANSFIMATKIG